MGFESFKRPENSESTIERRGRLAMDLIRTKTCNSYPAAIRQVLRNELVTNDQDVKRITSEVASYLASKTSQHEESEAWKELENEILKRDAAAADIRDRNILGDDY